MLLSNDAPPAAVVPAARPRLTIRGVRLPDYLDRRAVMYRASSSELKAFPDAVWAERPGPAITRWLAQELAARLPEYDVRSYSSGNVPGYVLETELACFEAVAPSSLCLRGTWRIADNAAWGGALDIQAPLAELSPDAAVEAMKSALKDAAGQIAARVRSLPPPAASGNR
ncbi:MAG: membrane integrity-associated transporter subunit PqiC [Nevskia sp.]|nr:membrane integrity-associated transporter subunit PqiC [Nevskia sp.]